MSTHDKWLVRNLQPVAGSHIRRTEVVTQRRYGVREQIGEIRFEYSSDAAVVTRFAGLETPGCGRPCFKTLLPDRCN
jgi:hypothetical protein